MTKTCSVCGEDKPVGEFPKNGREKDGSVRYRPDCKVCYNIVRKINNKAGRRKLAKFVNNTKHRTGEQRSLTPADWRHCMLHFGGCCAYCGTKEKRGLQMTKDHVVAVSKLGRTIKKNIVPACPRCNSSKGDSDLDEWYPKQDFYNEAKMVKIRMWTECLT